MSPSATVGRRHRGGEHVRGCRDTGCTTRFGVGTQPRDFGWDIATAGHNFTFATTDDWHAVIPGAILAHMGKHAPLLLVQRDENPALVARFLAMVRPTVTDPGGQLVYHGWILGDIGRAARVQLNDALSPNPAQAWQPKIRKKGAHPSQDVCPSSGMQRWAGLDFK